VFAKKKRKDLRRRFNFFPNLLNKIILHSSTGSVSSIFFHYQTISPKIELENILL
jgi:uncharacterized protein YaaN involved in tellurite resistance